MPSYIDSSDDAWFLLKNSENFPLKTLEDAINLLNYNSSKLLGNNMESCLNLIDFIIKNVDLTLLKPDDLQLFNSFIIECVQFYGVQFSCSLVKFILLNIINSSNQLLTAFDDIYKYINETFAKRKMLASMASLIIERTSPSYYDEVSEVFESLWPHSSSIPLKIILYMKFLLDIAALEPIKTDFIKRLIFITIKKVVHFESEMQYTTAIEIVAQTVYFYFIEFINKITHTKSFDKKEDCLYLVDLFRESFECIVLPVCNLNFIQFIWFYICSINQKVASLIIKNLWIIFTDKTKPTWMRNSAMFHISGLISRHSIFEMTDIINSLQTMANWFFNEILVVNDKVSCKNSYNYQHIDSSDYIIKTFSPFITHRVLIQSMFYIIVFTTNRFNQSSNGFFKDESLYKWISFIQTLGLDQMINHQCNPLLFCPDHLVEQFSSIGYNYQFVLCQVIIEKNRRKFGTQFEHLIGSLGLNFIYDPCYITKIMAHLNLSGYITYIHK